MSCHIDTTHRRVKTQLIHLSKSKTICKADDGTRFKSSLIRTLPHHPSCSCSRPLRVTKSCFLQGVVTRRERHERRNPEALQTFSLASARGFSAGSSIMSIHWPLSNPRQAVFFNSLLWAESAGVLINFRHRLRCV
jgi:hypothetical protein